MYLGFINMPKKQKVKFHRGDRRPRPDSENVSLTYRKRMKKKGHKIYWQVVEYPTKNVISEYFFREDAEKLVTFQNKNQVWKGNGGIPKFLFTRI
jgi:hypothetical protein